MTRFTPPPLEVLEGQATTEYRDKHQARERVYVDPVHVR